MKFRSGFVSNSSSSSFVAVLESDDYEELLSSDPIVRHILLDIGESKRAGDAVMLHLHTQDGFHECVSMEQAVERGYEPTAEEVADEYQFIERARGVLHDDIEKKIDELELEGKAMTLQIDG